MSRVIAFASALLCLALPAAAYAVPVNPVPAPSVTFNGPVRAAAIWGEVVYVGGDFTSATVNGVRYNRQRLAALGRTSGALLNWTPSADVLVTAVAADATGVYVGGNFAYVNGVKRDSLAKLDLGNGSLLPLSHKIYGHINTVAVGHGRLYAGGTITSVDGAVRKSVAAFSATTGALDAGWAPEVNGTVNTILPAADRIYLAGKFDNVNSSSGTQKIAALNPVSGAVDAGFASKVIAMVHDLYLSGDTLYAGVDGNGGKATAMTLAGVPKWTVSTDGDVQAIAELDGTVYLGGHFDAVCKSANLGIKGSCLDGKDVRVKLAAVDPAGKLLSWTANGNGSVGVHTIISDPARGQLLVCGEFTTINGSSQKRFALFRLPV